MWPFNVASRKFKKAQERDAQIAVIEAVLARHDTPAVIAALQKFVQDGHLKGEAGSTVVTRAFFAADRYDFVAAMQVGAALLPKLDRAVGHQLAYNIILLCEVPGRDDVDALAAICQTCNLVARYSHNGDMERAADSYWRKNFPALATAAPDRALAVAREAALNQHSWILSRTGVENWYNTAVKLAAGNPQAAAEEIARTIAAADKTGETRGMLLHSRALRVGKGPG